MSQLPQGSARFDVTATAFLPRVAHADASQIEVRLPLRAYEPFSLRQPTSGVSLEVSVAHARGVNGQVADGYIVYPAALGGGAGKSTLPDGTVLMRPSKDGIEDYVVFNQAPAVPAVEYNVTLGDKVAGLRLRSGVLEFLDAGGAPRLRMTEPKIVDGAGVVHRVQTEVAGCRYDQDPRAPWGRPVTDPGARQCTVRLTWDGSSMTYPALLDPQWVTTTHLVAARGQHTVTPFKCSNGDTCLLVAGGRNGTLMISPANSNGPSTEIYDISSNPPSTATTGEMHIPRYLHSATYIDDSADTKLTGPGVRIVVTGGTTTVAGTALRYSEYYNPATGAWVGLNNGATCTAQYCMAAGRYGHTATGIPPTVHSVPSLVVTGGVPSNGAAPTSSIEIYGRQGTETTMSWHSTWNGAAVASLGTARFGHAATVLNNSGGNSAVMLVAGGRIDTAGTVTNTAEEFDFNTSNQWVPLTGVASMNEKRATFALIAVAPNWALAPGGYGASAPLATGEYFDGATWHAVNGTLTSARFRYGAELLRSSGRVLVVSGSDQNYVYQYYTDIYDKATNSFYRGSNVNVPRMDPGVPDMPLYQATASTSFALNYGLALGGFSPSGATATNAAEKWTALGNGSACTYTGDCSSLFCVDAYCCNTACSGPCDACNITAGTCKAVAAGSPGAPTCSPYVCDGVNPSCPSSCTADTDCASGYYCNGAGSCVANKAQGDACSPTDCRQPGCRECGGVPGRCVDGYCCDSACSGSCQTCNQTGHTGQCTDLPDGTPGQPACSGDLLCTGTSGNCPTSCVTNADCVSGYYCDTSVSPHSCKLESSGTPCTTGADCPSNLFCADSVCCDTSCTGGCSNCNQAGKQGTCSPVPQGTPPTNCPSSTGFLCNGTDLGCPTTCLSDANCASGYYCASDSTCKPKKNQGSACNAGVGGDCLVAGCGVCATGNCVDGVCCNTACSGACDACNLQGSVGSCSPVGAGQPGNPSCAPYLCGSGSTCATTCTNNSDCANGAYCDGTGHCALQAGVGVACSTTAQCGTGLTCVDGVCCTSDCTGLCMACTAAKKGTGVNGICGAVANNTDPDNECPNSAASTCGTTGVCNGAGACTYWAAGTSCGTGTSCSSGQETTYQCDGSGTCRPAQTAQCFPYVCNGAVCGTTCIDDTGCDTSKGQYCDTSTNTCVGQQAAGAPCTAPDQCNTGFCVDGVCCDKACTGTCYACTAAKKGTGDDGTCGPIAKGTDPDNECPADPVSTCQRNGMCNGAGTCDFYAPGTACGSVTCVANTAVGKVCNTFNECKDDTTGVSCAPYLCSTGGCPGSCTDSSQCTSGFYCSAGQCLTQKQQGDTCTSDGECTTGHCADGVCCNDACSGQCQACNVQGKEGTCAPVSGDPPADKTPCNGTGVCKGTCDGVNPDCTYPDNTKTCEGTACDGNVFKPNVCDGQGGCVAGQSKDCGNYACDATAGACKTTCQSDSDCASGSSCDTATGQCAAQSSTCKDPFTVTQANGQEQSCSPYKCVGGACQQQCSTNSDCAPGYDCASSQCVPSSDAGIEGGKPGPIVSGNNGGCGCSVPRPSDSTPLFALGSVVLLVFERRRRTGRSARDRRQTRRR